MRRSRSENKAIDEINVTPLLDLAWTLLVVFIIAVTASIQGIKVNMPQASAAKSLTKPRTKAVSILADGQIYLDTYPVTLSELETYLRQYRAVDPTFPVVIKGDGKVYYENVVAVLDILQRLEITQLGLVTQRLVK
ncbi:MAG: biopolymer transporter ExbD [Desulfobacteraceae bacterium]|jgi:biopolymer transport protein ExbD